MIHEFTVSNFLSIREEAVIDLRIRGTAPHLNAFRHSVARPTLRVPTVVVLMGPNGSGKTTLLTALIRVLQIASARLGDSTAIESVIPFMSEKTRRIPTRFCLVTEEDWLAPGNAPKCSGTSWRSITGSMQQTGSKTSPTDPFRYAPKSCSTIRGVAPAGSSTVFRARCRSIPHPNSGCELRMIASKPSDPTLRPFLPSMNSTLSLRAESPRGFEATCTQPTLTQGGASMKRCWGACPKWLPS